MTEEDFKFLLSHFVPKRIRKKQYLLEEGKICEYTAFIVKGSMRKYFVDEKGVEHIVDLYVENWWAGDRESFVQFTPSNYNIDAWENCEVLLISRENTLKLCAECPAFNDMLLKLDERNSIATQKRITSTLSSCVEKRYNHFAEYHPDFVQRFPQHIIASYLGVTKDTLSRVRSKAIKK
ncbi:CRP-like cAMP-binding protein [Flavobacterium arsenatis]|uniref:CRP-like cAMP-binding protein n=1 Tax=Flavobacterium arsenatis TaxID=1484332 RepID=A0ABU1TQ88_9FLAO|nr:Crp/Fnr family transcriptional regulator [Flavobacterium arsenatis]MDR6968114.1 CRP-like cAMP-binding protein [Flavobacterium arsenatis]